jgi:geranylgeranyl pyrophosphate synthase
LTQRAAPEGVVRRLGFEAEIDLLQQALAEWVAGTDEEMRGALEWQFGGGSKFFRPLTVFSCYRAIYQGPIPPQLIRSTAVVEMFHNVSLIIDDILDDSKLRRGRHTFHRQFGNLPALMASGYIIADGYRMLKDDPHSVGLFSELLMRLGVAECMQWRLRRQSLGVEDWRRIAGEDTGSMFEVCACLGTRTEDLRRYGHLLGVLYHGCDDVGDVRGGEALGGGGDEDLRDGILTLPAALAIRDPEVARIFCTQNPSEEELGAVARALGARVPEAEQYLDGIVDEARREALRSALNPGPLLTLVDHTRQLSNR